MKQVNGEDAKKVNPEGLKSFLRMFRIETKIANCRDQAVERGLRLQRRKEDDLLDRIATQA